MKTYITYFDDRQIEEYNLKADENTVLFKGNDTNIDGDNINYLNIFYCELCTLYWVWKNTDDELLCFKQYRRPFDTDIVPKEGEVVCYQPIVMRDCILSQYIICHGRKRAKDLAEQLLRLYGEESKYVSYWVDSNVMLTNNTFIIHRKDFNKMCEFVFGVLFELDKYWKLNKKPYKYHKNAQNFTEDGRFDYQEHFMAYIGERLISCYILSHYDIICVDRPKGGGFYKPYEPKS